MIAAVGAIAVYSGIQLADASSSGSGSSVTAAATADPTPGPAAEAAADAAAGTGLTGPVEGDDANAIAEGGPAAFSAAVTAAAPPSGLGWKSNAATNLMTTGYTFKFRDQRAADWLGPYVKSIAAQMSQITNIRYTVDTHPVGTAYQRAAGDVLVMLHNRPCKPTGGSGISTSYKGVTDGSGAANFSCGFYWYNGNKTTVSGEAWIDSEFLTSTGAPRADWGGATFFKNHIAHELGHTMGLAHANNSTREGDCAKGADAGELPVMCRPSTAYKDRAAGRYVQQFDLQGLRTLAANGGAKPPAQGPVVGVGGKCLDARGGKSADGTQVQIYKCNNTAAQSWILNADGSINILGKCLDNYSNKSVDKNKIQLYTCNGSAAQKWAVNAKGQIVHVASGKVLDVTGGKTADGTAVQLYKATTGKNQLWTEPKA
ncbi:MAG: hypothetical protein HOV66_08725 [Streptomycetaceae bacterium]|nr:hypothetical protein [Streptomycetaceae bacterium]